MMLLTYAIHSDVLIYWTQHDKSGLSGQKDSSFVQPSKWKAQYMYIASHLGQ